LPADERRLAWLRAAGAHFVLKLAQPKRRMLSPEEKEKLRQEALEERDRYRRERSLEGR
jgi:hypothetical protein